MLMQIIFRCLEFVADLQIIGELVDPCMDVNLGTHTTVETFRLTHSVVNKRKIQKYYILTEDLAPTWQQAPEKSCASYFFNVVF
jgi:hypothetical protein